MLYSRCLVAIHVPILCVIVKVDLFLTVKHASGKTSYFTFIENLLFVYSAGDGISYPTRTIDLDSDGLLADRQRWMEEGESDGGGKFNGLKLNKLSEAKIDCVTVVHAMYRYNTSNTQHGIASMTAGLVPYWVIFQGSHSNNYMSVAFTCKN